MLLLLLLDRSDVIYLADAVRTQSTATDCKQRPGPRQVTDSVPVAVRLTFKSVAAKIQLDTNASLSLQLLLVT